MRAPRQGSAGSPAILVIDQHDSFTWNLVQAFRELGAMVRVEQHDRITVKSVLADPPDGLVLAPGPGGPSAAGVAIDLVTAVDDAMPILGVCLGQQVIGAAFGVGTMRLADPRHGKTSPVRHDGRGLFAGIATPFLAMRYHSMVLMAEELPPVLEACAWADDDGSVMGVRHRVRPIHAVQFHPESVLTAAGPALLANFLGRVRSDTADAA